jgi:oleandomycin transport system permease protein
MTTITAPAPAKHVSPAAAFRNSMTLTWRSVLKIRTNPEDIFGLTLNPIMFLLLFTYVFGGAISGNTHQYLQFELPGILVLSVIFATLGTGVMLNTDIKTGVFDRFRSLPIPRSAPLAGAVLGDLVRYAIAVAITLGFGMLLGYRITASPLAAAAGCVLLLAFAVAMCWISALMGLLVKSPQGVQWFGSLLYFPLTFGSNVLVQTKTMPGWLQAFVKVNPMTYLTQAERALLNGGPTATPVLRSVMWAVGIVVIFAPLAVTAYRRKA